MEVAACMALHNKWTDDEKKALPRRGDESWIGLYQEFLSVFRLPLQFNKLVGNCLHYAEGSNKTIVQTKVGHTAITAICSNIMRAGKHSVSFQVTDNHPSLFGSVACGIMRPTTKNITSLTTCFPVDCDLSMFSLKDYEMLHSNTVDCCLFNTWHGSGLIRKRWKKWEDSELMAMDEEQRFLAEWQSSNLPFSFEGQEQILQNKYKIGFVLDLDEGTLDVFKDDRRLGTMKTHFRDIKTHLSGEYCWVVTKATNHKGITLVSIGRQ